MEHLKESLQVQDLSDAIMAMDILEPVKISCNPTMLIPEVLKLFDENDTIEEKQQVLTKIKNNAENIMFLIELSYKII